MSFQKDSQLTHFSTKREKNSAHLFYDRLLIKTFLKWEVWFQFLYQTREVESQNFHLLGGHPKK